jgi:hypothetical protein
MCRPLQEAAKSGADGGTAQCFRESIQLGKLNCERLELPYGSSFIPALLTRAPDSGAPAACWFADTLGGHVG